MNTLIICTTIIAITIILCITYYKINYIKNNCNSYGKLNQMDKKINILTESITDNIETLHKRVNYLRDKVKEIEDNI